METKEPLEFDAHEAYFRRSLSLLPRPYEGLDANRLTLIYFCVSGLDLLGALEMDGVDRLREEGPFAKKAPPLDIPGVQAFVRALQVAPVKGEEVHGGFRGGTFLGEPFPEENQPTVSASIQHDLGHIAMTYTALAILKILGDDLSSMDRPSITKGLARLQQKDGSFSCVPRGENDMRFLFCACAVSGMLGDWSGVDVELAENFIRKSQRYDGGIAQGPGQESHGGSTYCAVAALSLMGKLDVDAPYIQRLKRWCLFKQQTGFQGRTNKIADTCYSFWIGATLVLLETYQFVNVPMLQGHIFSCQSDYGGFGKWPNVRPDVLHTYMSLCGLSMSGYAGLRKVNPSLNTTTRAVDTTIGPKK